MIRLPVRQDPDERKGDPSRRLQPIVSCGCLVVLRSFLLLIAEFPKTFCLLRSHSFAIVPTPTEICRAKEDEKKQQGGAHT